MKPRATSYKPNCSADWVRVWVLGLYPEGKYLGLRRHVRPVLRTLWNHSASNTSLAAFRHALLKPTKWVGKSGRAPRRMSSGWTKNPTITKSTLKHRLAH